MQCLQVSAVSALAAEVGESLKVGDYTESAAETQKLIDSRPDIQRPMENLNRGAVAVRWTAIHIFRGVGSALKVRIRDITFIEV